VVGIRPAMAVIAAMVVSAMPVTMIPRIIAGCEIDPDITGVVPVISRIRIIPVRIRIRPIIVGRADPDSYPDMYSGIGLAGEAEQSQQCND
jgi:hypothetical protein